MSTVTKTNQTELLHKKKGFRTVIKTIKAALFTTDPEQVKKYQLCTKINTADGNVLYASWSLFSGVQYFESMRNSGMIESGENPCIKFEHLNLNESKLYIINLAFPSKDVYCWYSPNEVVVQSDLINMYHQASLHLVDEMKNKCIQCLKHDNFSHEIYEFSLAVPEFHKRYVCRLFSTGINHPFRPPSTDDEFWETLITKFTNRHVISNCWNRFFRYMDSTEQMEKYMNLFNIDKNNFYGRKTEILYRQIFSCIKDAATDETVPPVLSRMFM